MGRPALGYRRTKTYWVWVSMKSRCQNPRHHAWENYGGRGIAVCDRWQSFDNFLADMGEAPEGMTLERKDNDGHYEPGNCRWATRTEQALNHRANRRLDFRGETLTVTEWADRLGISRNVIFARLRLGWPVADVLTKPIRAYAQKEYH